jgi:hypothetical protein
MANCQDYGGTIEWVESAGKCAPQTTGVVGEPACPSAEDEIYELADARKFMKPILVYFHKPIDLAGFDSAARKEPEAGACEKMDGDLWKRWIITELSKEFVCIRVNLRGADPKLIRNHRVARAPVVAIFDFNLKPIYFSPSPKLKHSALAKVMGRARDKVEKQVHNLARTEEDTEIVKRAVIRSRVIDQRELYSAGLRDLEKKEWTRAGEKFENGSRIPQDSEWREKCVTGLKEIQAGKLFAKAEKLIKAKKYRMALNILQRILVEFREAKYFGSLAKEKIEKVSKKLK